MRKHQNKTATLEQPTTEPTATPAAGRQPAGDGQGQKTEPLAAEAIQLRAYEKWEAAGKPQGNDIRFWLEAEEELSRPKKGRKA